METWLRAAGVHALYLFGSVGRGDAAAESDIDLLFEAEPHRRFSLLDQAQLQVDLSEKLQRPVDFIERRSLSTAIRVRAEAEMIRVF